MFLLIWMLLSVTTCVGKSGDEKPGCHNKHKVTLSERNITAEAGLCVVLPCSFTEPDLVSRNISWHKSNEACEKPIFTSRNDENTESEFRGRVLQPELKTNCSIIINDLTETDSGSYKPCFTFTTKNQKDCRLTSEETVTVTVKGLSQKPTVLIPPLTAGQQSTLTCTAPGLCSGSVPNITWSWRVKGQSDSYITGNITEFKTENVSAGTQRHISSLTFNLSAEHHGAEITCKVSFRGDRTTEETKTLSVTLRPKILNESVCERQSDVLTCVCVSEGIPLPTIKWPLLENLTQYSVVTSVSKQTVNSTVILTVKDNNNTAVECVSSNEGGEVKKQFNSINKDSQSEDTLTKLLNVVKAAELPTIIVFLTGFLMGIFVMTIITCLVIKCHRKKQKSSLNLVDTLEMVTTQTATLLDADQEAEVDVIHDQEAGAAEGGAGNVQPKEVEYSDINFSSIKQRNPTEGEKTTDTTETEYAEIKREEIQDRQDADGEDGEVLEGGVKKEEEEVEVEMQDFVPAEEKGGGEEVALYSNVNEMMNEI